MRSFLRVITEEIIKDIGILLFSEVLLKVWM